MGWFRRRTTPATVAPEPALDEAVAPPANQTVEPALLGAAPAAPAEPAAAPAAPAEPAATAAEVDDLRAQVAALRTQVEARLETLDQRLSSMGTELANQLTELGHDIDAIAANGPDGEAIAALRDGQTRLANEQARYQIAFLEDLAELADEVLLRRGERR